MHGELEEAALSKNTVIAIASGGGHWVQLMRLKPAFDGLNVVYVSLDPTSSVDVSGNKYYTISDASRKRKWAFPVVSLQILYILARERPKVVVTTGSAPGLIALILAKKLFRARTIWIDSIANAERLSTSGEKAGQVADIWLTQWPHLSQVGETRRPEHWGAVL
jgi:UDP-N-acetylglucosamine:LPS N-acetylglucosamine transferase